MNLEEIKEIKMCYAEKEVNDALKNKFVIKKIIQSKVNGDELSPCFILAKS